MDILYILTNTLIYGTIALVLQLFFAYHKFWNLLIGTITMISGYVIVSLVQQGWNINAILVSSIALGVWILTIFLVQKIGEEYKEVFGLVWTIGVAMVLENLTLYVFGPTSMSLEQFSRDPWILVGILLIISMILRYVMQISWIGKVATGIMNKPKVLHTLAIRLRPIIIGTSVIGLLLLIGVSFIILSNNTIKVSDNMFYLIKGTGIMVMIGITQARWVYVGSLIYVLAEYLLFITWGLPISYKETLILVVILIVLLWKPEGLFSKKKRIF